LSLSLSYSLFDGGSSWVDRVVRDVQLAAAQEDFESSVKDLRYDLQRSYNDLLDALEALKVAEVALAAGRERAKITEVKYLNGLTGYDEWYRIDNTYISARRSLLNYQRSALLAEAAWHESYGGYVK
jgi:outer membrane protein TolC